MKILDWLTSSANLGRWVVAVQGLPGQRSGVPQPGNLIGGAAARRRRQRGGKDAFRQHNLVGADAPLVKRAACPGARCVVEEHLAGPTVLALEKVDDRQERPEGLVWLASHEQDRSVSVSG